LRSRADETVKGLLAACDGKQRGIEKGRAMHLSVRYFGTVLILALLAPACATPDAVPGGGDTPAPPGGPGGAQDVTEVQVALTSVPTGVLCVKITATIGNQTTTAPLLNVAAGSSTGTLSLGQLPLGAATFNGFAYSVACSSVTGSTTASWIADPASATLAAGVVTVVPLTFRKNNPVTVSANFLDNVASFSVGGEVNFALMTDGTVRSVSGSQFAAPSTLTNVVQLGSAFAAACARKSDGSVWCWGANDFGLMPTAPISSTYTTTLVQIGLPGPATDLAVGGGHGCAIVARTVYCWGLNFFGEAGTTAGDPAPVSAVMPFGNLAGRVFAGDYHSCLISSAGALYCWGRNDAGQLGRGTSTAEGTSPQGLPFPSVVNVDNVVDVAMGEWQTCALRGNGTVACWGAGELLGNGSVGGVSSTPVAVAGLTDATQVAAGDSNTCARRANGQVSCWGAARTLGTGAADSASTPVPVLGNAVAVRAAHGSTTCAELADRTAKCWGDNTFGEIGDGTFMFAALPTFVKLQ
jgi:alpha-tubulin suppressor-like RCC1 family protein